MSAVLDALKACELQLREYVQWHHQNAGGCSVEMETAWEKARDAIVVAEAEAQQRLAALDLLNDILIHHNRCANGDATLDEQDAILTRAASLCNGQLPAEQKTVPALNHYEDTTKQLLKVLEAAYLNGGGSVYQEEFGRVCFCPRHGKPGSHATACDMLNTAIQPLLPLLDKSLLPDNIQPSNPTIDSALAMVRELYELALVAIRTGGDPLSDSEAWKAFQSEPDGKDATLNRARAMLGLPLVAYS